MVSGDMKEVITSAAPTLVSLGDCNLINVYFETTQLQQARVPKAHFSSVAKLS